ncbi:PREDICTED: toll-like receptor 7 [Ficedula albicollis]|uniref:toll-like receptor 7 n=1 Tax=Ficedula albicollis TaxID=59894 RepID=UPI0007AD7EC8|nr:PREDICTED: toll-like receptor 7 [Ficedula albicollis]
MKKCHELYLINILKIEPVCSVSSSIKSGRPGSTQKMVESLLDFDVHQLSVFASVTAGSVSPAGDGQLFMVCCAVCRQIKVPRAKMSNALPFILLFIFPMLLSGAWFPKTLPCDVKSSEGTVTVDCTDRRLTEVPRGIPGNATNLTLSINHIPHIYPTTFNHLESLEEIDFRCNCVPVKLGPKDRVCSSPLKIENGSFAALTSLRSLYLDANQLAEIPRGLPATLSLLSLEANSIFSIQEASFSELGNIEALYLGQNCYYRNPCNVSFEIEKTAFLGLKKLTILSLKSDNLTQIPPTVPRAKMSNALPFILLFIFPMLLSGAWFPKTLPCDVKSSEGTVTVDCTDRRLTEVPRGIPGNATNLTLSINHIPHIYPTTFNHLESLEEIDFRCNCVPVKLGPKDRVCSSPLKIENGSFAALTSLRSLYLDANQLAEIPRGLPATLSLLSLEANSIFSIQEASFSELGNIEALYLGQNCYYRNPCNVSFEIEKTAFLGLKKLTILSLKSDNLTQIPPNLSSTLRELYIYNNMIQEIQEEDLSGVPNLEILDLSGNCPRCYNAPYPCIPCPKSSIQIHSKAFDSLENLRILRLHSNSLQSIPSSWFKNMKNLQELDLSQNFLMREIGDAQFLTFIPSLVQLDLSFNFQLKMYSPYLNLSKTFSSLSNLETLRLKGYVFKELRARDLRPLLSLRNLTMLDLGTNFIKIANLTVFEEFPALKFIDLSVNKISPSSGESNLHGFCSSPGISVERYNGQVQQEMHYFRYDFACEELQVTSSSSVKTASILTEFKATGTENGEGFGVEFSLLPRLCLDSGVKI